MGGGKPWRERPKAGEESPLSPGQTSVGTATADAVRVARVARSIMAAGAVLCTLAGSLLCDGSMSRSSVWQTYMYRMSDPF
jgi:hypothetical protein